MQHLTRSILLWLALAIILATPAHALLASAQTDFSGCYTPKYRVMGYAENAPGRFAFCPELKLQLAMGCDVRGEAIASGQGRFLSADPLGHDGSMDLYSYCNGDPVNGLDPDGRMSAPGSSNFESDGASGGTLDTNSFGPKQDLTPQDGSTSTSDDYFDQRQQQFQDLVYNTQQADSAAYQQYLSTPAQATQQDIDENTQQFYSSLGNAAMVGSLLIPGVGEEAGLAEGGELLSGGAIDMGLDYAGRQAAEEVTPATTTAIQPYYPANNGFLGETTTQYLSPDDLIDRNGGTDFSRFFSPVGTPEAARSLPAASAAQPLRTFEVVKPFPVQSGTVAPALGQPGFGTQYVTPVSLSTLLKRGIIRETTP